MPPTMSLTKTFEFAAAHRLTRVPAGHPCAKMHGHTYEVEVEVKGSVDPEKGWVIDFAVIKDGIYPYLNLLEHNCLNELGGLENPTSENLALWLWKKLKPSLPLLFRISVAESRNSRCDYWGD